MCPGQCAMRRCQSLAVSRCMSRLICLETGCLPSSSALTLTTLHISFPTTAPIAAFNLEAVGDTKFLQNLCKLLHAANRGDGADVRQRLHEFAP
eukprot:4992246-Amphidinium_carterae.1